jgi:serine/threonine-protein kinase
MRQPLVIRRGRYDLILPLGEGRMTRVYLAESADPANPAVKSLCVVKRLRPELAQHPRIAADFSGAAHLGTRLRHPRIAETYEVFTEGGEQLFAMEYLEGQTLAELLRRVGRERMPVEEHLYVLCQALEGLAHCHGFLGPDGRPCGGNHREANATNVFVTYDGQVKLVDFALSEHLPSGLATRDEVHKGIGPFAPEQLCGLAVDARSDVFAMGILLWEALARRPRAVGDDRAALIAARVAGSEPGLEALPPGLPRELIDICARATELDPAGRYAHPGELLAALERVRQSFPRVAGPAEVGTLVARTFQMDRDALCRRINQHLEDCRSPVRINTPPALTPEPNLPSSDREVTVPGRIPARGRTPRDSFPGFGALSSEEIPLVPARSRVQRLGLPLLGLGAAALLVGGVWFARKDEAPAPVADKAHGPGWEPLARPQVALDRDNVRDNVPTVVPTRGRKESELPTAQLPPPVPVAETSVARILPPRPRARRAANSPELTRSTPVPLIDASGALLSVPRTAVHPPPMPSAEPGRGTSSPRRQLDEQDPYK